MEEEKNRKDEPVPVKPKPQRKEQPLTAKQLAARKRRFTMFNSM